MLANRNEYEKLRKHPRVSLHTELWIGQDGIFTRTDEFLLDLSLGGAFIQSRQVYPVGSVINLRFKIPEQVNPIGVTAVVRNMQIGEGFGVEFLDISAYHLRVIERRIEKSLEAGD